MEVIVRTSTISPFVVKNLDKFWW